MTFFTLPFHFPPLPTIPIHISSNFCFYLPFYTPFHVGGPKQAVDPQLSYRSFARLKLCTCAYLGSAPVLHPAPPARSPAATTDSRTTQKIAGLG